jgi:cell wall-associated NlpC family hydrolase
MADSGHGRRQRRRSPVISPVLRPALWSALLGAVAAAVLATPAYAEPPLPNTIPDAGARPVAAAGLRLPGGMAPGATLPGTPGPPTSNLGNGPLAIQISAAEAQFGALGEQLLGLREQRTVAEAQLATADRDLKLAEAALVVAQHGADAAAADAFKAAAALPPGEFAADLRDLSRLQQINRGDQAEGGTTAAAGELARARAGREIAYQAFVAVDARARNAREQFTAVEKAMRTQEAALLKLRRDNAAQLVEIERQQEAAEQRLGAAYLAGQSSTGLVASPQALGAVRYALAQLGDPYLWAAEGPDRFDCSGLMWAAYRSAGYQALPRVARDQYYATRAQTVDRSALLPGDLLFFASGSSWTTVHHVGMYIGGGKMVHAPTTGDVVKISTVRWSGLYAATRVVGAVPAPPTSVPVPTPSPTPTASRTPTPIRTATAKPTPRPTRSSPSPSPSTSPPPTPPTAPSAAPSSASASSTPSTAPSSLAPSDSTSATTTASTGS